MTGRGKRRKTKTGFTFVSPSPWKSLRDFHIPTPSAAAIPFSPFSDPVRSRPADARNQQRQSRKELFAAFYALPTSGSSRIGINLPFQAHRALKLIFRFRLICGLENAHPLQESLAEFRSWRGRKPSFSRIGPRGTALASVVLPPTLRAGPGGTRDLPWSARAPGR